MTRRALFFTVIPILLAFGASIAHATAVGTIAAVEGEVDLGRQELWEPAAVGDAVAMGDEVRTGAGGRAKIVFEDESLISVSVDSHITIDEYIFDPDGASTSVFKLLRGKLNAIVTEYYKTAGSRYEIRTPTATAGVRGTEFVVSYDEIAETTDLLVVSGIVAIHSSIDPTGPGVLVTAEEVATVESGELPSEPVKTDGIIIDQRLEEFDFIGAATIGGAGATNPIATGSAVGAPEQAQAGVSAFGANGGPDSLNLEQTDASTLSGAPPAVVIGIGDLGIDVGQPK